MNPETEAKLALVLATLRWLQEKGADVPQPGEVTPKKLSRLSRELDLYISEKTIRREFTLALAKARHAASQRGRSYFLSPSE